MRKQQQIWQDEHASGSTLPFEMLRASATKPSSKVVQFYEFLQSQGVPHGKVVDIGAGKGRNSFFFAKQGFQVFALDYIREAVEFIEEVAKSEGLSQQLQASCTTIDDTWPFPDNFFDVAIDCFASIDIETQSGRERYRSELLRTLKPGGYALVTVVSSDDEIESELIRTSPGPEKNSSIWPANGKFQKNYDEAELREFYKECTVIDLRKLSSKAHKLGRDYIATNFWLVLQKPE